MAFIRIHLKPDNSIDESIDEFGRGELNGFEIYRSDDQKSAATS